MADFDKSEIKAVLNKAKSSGEPVHYAFGLAGKPEDCAFVLSKLQNGKKLMASLKGDKALKKIGYGTVTYDGRTMAITEERPAKGISRMLLKLFKANGLAVKPALADEDADADADSADATAAADGADDGASAVDPEVKKKALDDIVNVGKELEELKDLFAEVEKALQSA